MEVTRAASRPSNRIVSATLRAILLAASWLPASDVALSQSGQAGMIIRFTLNGRSVVVTLDDNATTRDFLAKLPIRGEIEPETARGLFAS